MGTNIYMFQLNLLRKFYNVHVGEYKAFFFKDILPVFG